MQRKKNSFEDTIVNGKKQESAVLMNGIHDNKLKRDYSEYSFHNWQNQVDEKKKQIRVLTLWRHPILTSKYFFLECLLILQELFWKVLKNWRYVLCLALTIAFIAVFYNLDGPHQSYFNQIEKKLLWCLYWVGLGILSSVGLGTGLHTFVLYLGPHIAAVTLAAFECMSVNFPEPPYPNEIICPNDGVSTQMTIWTIMSKVRLEAFMWGAGTAIGELPPYFMARAARLSGSEVDDENLNELETMLHDKKHHPNNLPLMERVKLYIHQMIERVGFIGILLCASIPNPLFDLAGITCGHFLVPFWTFFGATLIGKAVIKMHIQKLFVIFTFSEKHVEHIISLMGKIPYFGVSFQAPFREYLQSQKAKLHQSKLVNAKAVSSSQAWLPWCFEKLVMLMIIYFLLSIVNSLAQKYEKRLLNTNTKSSSTSQSSNLQRPPLSSVRFRLAE